jgi:hypothetical protein
MKLRDSPLKQDRAHIAERSAFLVGNALEFPAQVVADPETDLGFPDAHGHPPFLLVVFPDSLRQKRERDFHQLAEKRPWKDKRNQTGRNSDQQQAYEEPLSG